MKRWQTWLEDRNALEYDFNDYAEKGILRRIGPEFRLSDLHLNKAFHNIDFAAFTISHQKDINRRIEEETYYDWVIVISYYAMYHSAMALLYSLGYKAGTHLATICVLCWECLGKNLEKRDIEKISHVLELSEDEIREIGRAKERRERASYSGSVSFERNLAEKTLDDARSFINKIADILEGSGKTFGN